MGWNVRVRLELTLAVDAPNQATADETAVKQISSMGKLIDPKACASLAVEITDLERVEHATSHVKSALSYLETLSR